MKSNIGRIALLVTLIAATTLLSGGCAMFGTHKPSTATATLQSVQDDYDLAELLTEDTEDALDELAVSPDVDLEQAYDAFSESAYRLQLAGRPLIRHADAMHYAGASYLVESEKTPDACEYPRAKKLEKKKPADVGAFFDAIAEESWEVKRAYRAYQFDIGAIRDSLSTRLTPAAVEGLDPIIRKAKIDGYSLRESLEQAMAQIELAKANKPQPSPGGAPKK
jgi:hypothetical protein